MNATDHFTLFGLPRAFAIDPQVLEVAWKRVATAVHPDRFASGSAAEKRVALQWSTQANEAWRVLKDPLSRARYLCELGGVDLQTETNTAMAPEFLWGLLAGTVGFSLLFGGVVLARMRTILANSQAEARLRRRAMEASDA